MATYEVLHWADEWIGIPDEETVGAGAGSWEYNGDRIEIKDETEEEIIKALNESGYFAEDTTPSIDFNLFPDSIHIYTMREQILIKKQEEEDDPD